jgi:hypothetical protein
MRPRTAADVPFTGDGKVKDFVLDDDTDPTLPSSATFTNLKPGAYEIEMEESPDGPLTEIRCVSTGGTDNNAVDLAARRVTINVESSESVACAFIDGWETGDLTTASQTEWGDPPTAATALLNSTFSALYPLDLVVGTPNQLRFEHQSAVYFYLPAGGAAGVLASTIVDPTSTSAGEFGGEATALRLNADHSTHFDSAVPLAGLTICGLATLPAMNGNTIGQFLDTANHILGGGSTSITAGQASALARFINLAFVSGTPSTFAQASLFDGACP